MKFEDNLKRLEAIVEQMESGKKNLDEMIALFEEGRTLVKACQTDLQSIQTKIEKVTAEGAVEPLKL